MGEAGAAAVQLQSCRAANVCPGRLASHSELLLQLPQAVQKLLCKRKGKPNAPPARARAPPASAAPAGTHHQCCRWGCSRRPALSGCPQVLMGRATQRIDTQHRAAQRNAAQRDSYSHGCVVQDVQGTAQRSTAQQKRSTESHMAALYRMYMTVGLKAHTRPLVSASSAQKQSWDGKLVQ